MKKNSFVLLLSFLSVIGVFAQQTVKGKVVNSETEKAIANVVISVVGTTISEKTILNGSFELKNVPIGNQIIKIQLSGFEAQQFPIKISNKQIDLGKVLLFKDLQEEEDLSTISLSDDELDDDAGGADNISGLLFSSRNLFSRTAAFEFSSSFFRVRGLDSDNATVTINGIEMNKIYNGRPQWSNWGGLNDVLRNQELTEGINASSYTFGGILGATNINARASEARVGGRLTYSSSNRSYTNRVMASYASGLNSEGWAFTVSIGRRWGQEGYLDASSYNASSLFASVEKKINDKHSINLTSIFASNKRGKSSPNTQEVFDLKDRKYNEFWGYQNGKRRNSRIKEVEEPVLMLNHYWTMSEKTSLNTNVAYQTGKIGNSRIDNNGNTLADDGLSYFGGGANPSPTYYQLLPSYLLRDFPDNTSIAYGAQQQFLADGQIDWDSLYDANLSNTANGLNATYALYEDRVDDTQITFNTIFNTELNDNILLDAGVTYKNLKSENFAQVIDLLGGTGYLDVDGFAENIDEGQNDLLNPNRIVGKGDKFKYNYEVLAEITSAFTQVQFKYNKVDFFLAGSVTNTQYQRDGLYKNGGFSNNSFGKSKKLTFTGIGAKGGLTYKITGNHLLNVNGAYITKAPSIRNTFSNSRENNAIVGDKNGLDITEEKILSTDISYILRSPKLTGKITGYYTKIQDATEISFFFADGIGGDNTAFVQEVLQGIDKLHIGTELALEYQITTAIKLKGVASLGQYTYANNPNLTLTTEPDTDALAAGFDEGFKDFGQSNLKNYKLAGGPQTAYSVGFEYRDPNFWWFGATANFFSDTYIDVSPLIRSSNFTTDFDGITFNDYDEDLARELLKQERFDDYMVVNLVGGKSWKINNKFIGFFASINNLLDKDFRTGGFEQARNANYRQLRDDKALDTQVFGSRYWKGRGATYFLNVYLRF
ncbi:MAG: TonB-dependent receptor [Flavobacteriaceae bacterium]|nr:TonB-dependent receptor [Flavobacteriaceae bacterium]